MANFTMNFDMNASNLGSGVSNSALAGNKIHNVLFKGVEYSQSKDGKWEFMNIKFSGVNGGYFTDRVFGLDAKSGERTQGQYGPNPSQYEMLMMKIKHLIAAVAPELLQQMQKGEVVFTPKNKNGIFKQYVEFIGECLKPYIDTATEIKLVTDKKGQPCFPMYFVGITKEDAQTFMRTSFIGKNLSFTTKELEAMEIKEAAKPTTMPSLGNTSLSLGDDDDDNKGDDLMNMQF